MVESTPRTAGRAHSHLFLTLVLVAGLLPVGDVALAQGPARLGCPGFPLFVNPTEADFDLQITVERILISSAARFSYSTADGTAKDGRDYVGVSGTVTIDPYTDPCAKIFVPILQDSETEGDETFTFTIEGLGGTVIEGPNSVIITIVDDDLPDPPDIRIHKTDNGHLWQDDPLIPYVITVTNEAAEFVELREIVPVNTTFVAEESDSWECMPGPGEGSVCLISVLAFPADLSVREIRFAVRVNEGTDPQFEVFNEVTTEIDSGDPLPSRSANEITLARIFFEIHQLCACFFQPNETDCEDLVEYGFQRVPGASSLQADPLTLFRLRDRVLHQTPGGRRAVQLFYEHGIDIARAAFAAPGYFAKSHDTLVEWEPLFRALNEGRGDELVLSASQIQGMRDFFEDLEPFASPSLVAAIDDEVSRLDLSTAAGLDMDQALARFNLLSCEPSSTTLCLNDGRFRAEVEWQDFQGNTGRGRAVALTGDTGTFWFFNEANVELVVKVLDARALNNRFWVFYGALSNVEYTLTVTDTATGFAKSYYNPPRQFASVGDTDAFDPDAQASNAGVLLAPPKAWWSQTWDFLSAGVGGLLWGAPSPQPGGVFRGLDTSALSTPARLTVTSTALGGSQACDGSVTVLCLNQGRFRVEVEWEDFRGNRGQGQAVPLTSDTGTFWFFDIANVELIVKVLDGRAINGRFWVFYGALSNVEYTITVTDTENGNVRTYTNPLSEFGSVGDTEAF